MATDSQRSSNDYNHRIRVCVVDCTIIVKCATARGSFIYLDALSATGCVQIKLLKLPQTLKLLAMERLDL